MRKQNLYQEGAILIEAILALTVIVVLMTALVSALVASLSSSNYSKNQTRATGYAQEGLEAIRSIRDQDYVAFKSNYSTGNYCLPKDTYDPQASPSVCAANIDGVFSRSIYINANGKDSRPDTPLDRCSDSSSFYVVSSVAWTDSKCSSGDMCHKVELDGCFSNLDSLPGL